MAKRKAGDWWDQAWNPITGCTRYSPGCTHCWAEGLVKHFPHLHGYQRPMGPDYDDGDPVPFQRVQFHSDRLDAPLGWRRPRIIFPVNLGDMFHNDVPDEWILAVLNTMRACDARDYGHVFTVLTKRAARLRDVCSRARFDNNGTGRMYLDPGGQFTGWSLFPQHGCSGLRNVWIGVTVCNQVEAEDKIPLLLTTPAALRYVCIEPMLGPIELNALEWRGGVVQSLAGGIVDQWGISRLASRLDWVICGGETGPGARRVASEWVYDLRDQCAAAGVPFWFKGWGTGGTMRKRYSSYMLVSGRQHLEMPAVAR